MRLLLTVMLSGLLFVSCKSEYEKLSDGKEFKISPTGSGDNIIAGDYIVINVTQFLRTDVKDTILRENVAGIPFVERIDSVITDKEFYYMITKLRKGDSVTVRVSTDSIFKNNFNNMPTFMKRGQQMFTTIKVLDVIKDEKLADSLRLAYFVKSQEIGLKKFEEMKKAEEEKLNNYLQSNKINATKTPLGVYVEILKEGTGPLADSNNVVKVNYTGKTFEGEVFDSNTDPAFNHVEPLLANLTQDQSLGMQVIPGWTDGLKFLNKGAQARLYIPSALAYGERGSGDKIQPNTMLIFDVEVLDILNRDQAKVEFGKLMEKMMQQQLDEGKK